MKKLKISLLATGFMLMLFGCKKSFLDINNDPNRATETSITPNLLLAPQLNNIAARNASSWDMLNRWMGYWSASGSYSRATVEMSYNITNTTMEGTWNNLYYVLKQLKTLETKAAERDWKYYQGIAKIMQAHDWQILVDLYGDVPFTEALDFATKIRPAYSKGEDVYKALIPMIDEGIALIKDAVTGDNPDLTTQDVMFGGNKTNWFKFANTLKLRILLHAQKANIFNNAAEIAKITTEGSGFLGNGVGAMVNPGYNADRPNPYYAAHLHVQNGNEADNYNRANCYAFDLMGSQDLRRTRVYRTARGTASTYRCTSYGMNPTDDLNSDRTSGPGYGLIGLPLSVFTVPPQTAALAGASASMWVMTSVEAAFHVAEATARGWLAGSAQEAYENAVRESFNYLALTNTDANDYLATGAATSNPRIAFPASGSMDQQIAVIAWQKYLALNGLQGNETWTDWRRLGVVNPPLSVAPERGNNPIPRRILYPSAEYSYNAGNAPTGINQFTSRIFWDK